MPNGDHQIPRDAPQILPLELCGIVLGTAGRAPRHAMESGGSPIIFRANDRD